MKNTVERKEIRQTKKLDAALAKYNIKLRVNDSQVTHLTYGMTTEVPPLVFAAFELAIKANYCGWISPEGRALADRANSKTKEGGTFVVIIGGNDPNTQNRLIAERNGFSLDNLPQVSGKQAADDYNYACRLIADAGYYRELLD
jgi:hypothetical protein